jgi:hypothetical protein
VTAIHLAERFFAMQAGRLAASAILPHPLRERAGHRFQGYVPGPCKHVALRDHRRATLDGSLPLLHFVTYRDACRPVDTGFGVVL